MTDYDVYPGQTNLTLELDNKFTYTEVNSVKWLYEFVGIKKGTWTDVLKKDDGSGDLRSYKTAWLSTDLVQGTLRIQAIITDNSSGEVPCDIVEIKVGERLS